MAIEFNKQTESTESKELNEVKATEAQAQVAESTDNASAEPENQPETATETEETKKALVTYIGHSEWIDSNGKKWTNGVNESFTTKEYEERADIQFMVRYGEMKMQLV